MTDKLGHKPLCPRCQSGSLVPVYPKTIVLTGIGGLLGGLIGAAGEVIAEKDDNGSPSPELWKAVSNVLEGAVAGFILAKALDKETSGKKYFCLDCFNTFTIGGLV